MWGLGQDQSWALIQPSYLFCLSLPKDLIDKIAKLEDAKSSLAKELDMINKRCVVEQENMDTLTQSLRKIESSQGGLGKEVEANENK